MLGTNFFGYNSSVNQNTDEDGYSSDDQGWRLNLSDPLLKCFTMRDFPFTLKEQADVQEIYKAVTLKSFNIKDCRSICLGNFGQSEVSEVLDVSLYPRIVYQISEQEEIGNHSLPIYESSLDEGMTD